jgi:Zn-dependent M28 family amino/carboxypeptidase
VIYNNVPGSLAGTLGGPGDFAPTVGITADAGQALLAQLGAGVVQGTILTNVIEENRTTYNVLAETKGGDHNNVVVAGGHSDSVEAGPGINDDGSGIVGILNVALALTKFEVKNAVRFGFWSAEEFGLLGSEHYMTVVNQTAEIEKIRLYLNFDMIASPNYIYGIYDGDGNAFNISGPPGSAEIEATFEKFFASAGLNSVPTAFTGRSDYGPFLDNNIPAGGLFTGAEVVKTEEEVALFGGIAGVAYDENYHEAGDTIDNLNLEAFLVNTKAIADSIATYATSLDTIPPVVKPNKFRRTYMETIKKFRRRAAEKHAHGRDACGKHERSEL